ncbi:MAG: SIS domain-containing protein [Acidobacteria bacterium]|uniref:Glutamine--fructose-6-phosphate aminotransferase [isomerizing] n=2 Tax=Acidipila rosea TaxID=768535 RepID=A0A4R1L5Z6_9BACT|nr:SIS domain-containing protein [Acidobacteriota bacterium]MBW4045422.1 SIS domain-containing protein [Acidobacteriota bacterium]TCK72470.1 glutamine--fructose-6-phosphate transaminase [Acidipila rosea]
MKNSSESATGRSFAHAMLREIYEQPQSLRDTANSYVSDGGLSAEAFAAAQEALRGHQRLVIAASGSSRHAGLAGEIMLEDLAGLTVDVEYASEYCYRSTHTLQDPGVIVISQSGETADTLAALREAKSRGLSTIAITNNAASTMAREADASLPTAAGKEKAIPATKSFTTQLGVLYLLTLAMARLRGRMTAQGVSAMLDQFAALPGLLEQALPRWEQQVHEIAEQTASARTFLYLGRGVHYAIAREGALKLKESAYVQAEGYPAGELKHGPNALVSKDAPLVMIATQDRNDPDSVLRYEKTLQLMKDMQAQGAEIIALALEGDTEVNKLARWTIEVPAASEYLLTILEVVPLQLLAYFTAILRGIDVDNPRNLVKAVVAE